MLTGPTVETTLRFRRTGRRGGNYEAETGRATETPKGRTARISRLMALAIRLDELIRSGSFRNYADLARIGQVSRNRVSDIMNLLLLAPDIQEELLFMARVTNDVDPIFLKDLQPIAIDIDWTRQRSEWTRLAKR